MSAQLISVIVPIYNVGKYLRHCLDSILAQTYKNLEIILVDDGSTDSCPGMCDEYSQVDPRVKVIHKSNGGLGSAYNAGIKLANGAYIGFVEADDWIEPEMYQVLLDSALKFDSDIVKCNFYDYRPGTQPPRKENGANTPFPFEILAPDNRSFSIEEYPKLLLQQTSIWAALYKKDLLLKNPFVETPQASYQDYPFWIGALFSAQKISVVYKPLVNYRQEGNLSSTNRTDKRLMILADQSLLAYQKVQNDPKFSKCIEEFVYSLANPNYWFFRKIDEQYKRDFFIKIKKAFAFMDKKQHLTYKYLTLEQQYFVKTVLNDNFEAANTILSIKSYCRGLIRKEKTKNSKKIFVLGHLIYSKVLPGEN